MRVNRKTKKQIPKGLSCMCFHSKSEDAIERGTGPVTLCPFFVLTEYEETYCRLKSKKTTSDYYVYSNKICNIKLKQ